MNPRPALLPALLLSVLLPAAALAADAPPAPVAKPLAFGAKAPMSDVKLLGVDGRQVTLAGLAGPKGTLVVFSCNTCPWAKAWEGRLVELGNTYSKRGFGVVVVNPNDPKAAAGDDYESMKQRARERGMAFPYVVDGTSDLARAFGATRTPEAFLFDAKGTLVYHGALDDNARQPESVKARYLRDALEAVAAGKPVAVQDTKALGCTIKFRARSAS